MFFYNLDSGDIGHHIGQLVNGHQEVLAQAEGFMILPVALFVRDFNGSTQAVEARAALDERPDYNRSRWK